MIILQVKQALFWLLFQQHNSLFQVLCFSLMSQNYGLELSTRKHDKIVSLLTCNFKHILTELAINVNWTSENCDSSCWCQTAHMKYFWSSKCTIRRNPKISALLTLLAISAITSTLPTHCLLEDQTERGGPATSSHMAIPNKTKMSTPHPNDCLLRIVYDIDVKNMTPRIKSVKTCFFLK